MDSRDEFYLPEEVVEWINLKKSEYLSLLIEKGIPGDFGFEEFHYFNDLVPQTIETPDKSFEDEIDQNVVRTFIKTYSAPVYFHQVIIGGIFMDQKNQAEVFVPIIVFVTKKAETVHLFSRGKVISRPTLS